MLAFVNKTIHPDAYHGQVVRPPFFEGWYFKLVTPGLGRAYAVIPGIYHAQAESGSHAFIQVMDGRSTRSAYYQFPASAFQAADGKFEIDIGPNHFSQDGLQVDLSGQEISLRGELRNLGLTPWPVTLTSPGIMGWYAWMPFMECYHGVVSLDHALQGQLEVDGQPVDFSGGRGYIEKDWGRAFPLAYVWMQSNHFSAPGTSLTASIAVIPWLKSAFNGFIIGLWHGGCLYRFATYTGARVDTLHVSDESVLWMITDRRYRLEILAQRSQGSLLHAPTTLEMDRRIAESLDARIEVRLLETSGGDSRLLFHDRGVSAGLEVVGNVQRLSVA